MSSPLLRTYERLSRVYDFQWTRVAYRYVDLVRSAAEKRGLVSARILDLACGTGILATSLAGEGHSVLGIDVSPEMIDVARAKAGDLSNVEFRVQNMADREVSEAYDIVTCTFNSINYLTTAEQMIRMFGGVASALKENGVFLFDSNTERLYENHHSGTDEHIFDGEHVHQELTYDPVNLEARTVFCFSDGSFELHRQRPYDLRALEPLMNHSGLTILEIYGGFNGEPYESDSERLFCVAEKSTG